jgi:hypothetical protein
MRPCSPPPSIVTPPCRTLEDCWLLGARSGHSALATPRGTGLCDCRAPLATAVRGPSTRAAEMPRGGRLPGKQPARHGAALNADGRRPPPGATTRIRTESDSPTPWVKSARWGEAPYASGGRPRRSRSAPPRPAPRTPIAADADGCAAGRGRRLRRGRSPCPRACRADGAGLERHPAAVAATRRRRPIGPSRERAVRGGGDGVFVTSWFEFETTAAPRLQSVTRVQPRASARLQVPGQQLGGAWLRRVVRDVGRDTPWHDHRLGETRLSWI